MLLALLSLLLSSLPAGAAPSSVDYIQRAALRCADPRACEPAVGLLAVIDGDDVGQCTGFLVAPDVVATNAHCVTEELRKRCDGQAYIHFAPAPGHADWEERGECAEVLLAAGEKGDNVADYAFLRLRAPSRRPPLAISRAGIRPGEHYRLVKVDPVEAPGRILGVQRTEANCRSLGQSTEPRDEAATLVSRVSYTAGCRSRVGNSGSPLLGPDGTVRGVHFAGLVRGPHEPPLTPPPGALSLPRELRVPRVAGGAGLRGAGPGLRALNSF